MNQIFRPKILFVLISLLGLIFWFLGNFFLNIFFTPSAIFHTNFGTFQVQLYPQKAPKTVQNFVGLASKGKYNQTQFHRLVKGFILQGGDFELGNGTGGESIWGQPFEDEFSPDLSHVRGMISMANKGEKDTNESQFFIVLGESPNLDRKHSIFGQISEGMDVIEKMEKTPTNSFNSPIEPLKIESIQISWKWKPL